MTEGTAPTKKKPGSATLKAALVLLVLGVVIVAMGATGGNIFILGAVVCAVVGGIQKRSVSR